MLYWSSRKFPRTVEILPAPAPQPAAGFISGLDYWHLVEVADYESLDDLFRRHPEAAREAWLTTTKAPRPYTKARFTAESWLFFGKETAGLPEAFRERFRDRCIRLPMVDAARSLNLSNTVAVCVYEALRQIGFPGLQGLGQMAASCED